MSEVLKGAFSPTQRQIRVTHSLWGLIFLLRNIVLPTRKTYCHSNEEYKFYEPLHGLQVTWQIPVGDSMAKGKYFFLNQSATLTRLIKTGTSINGPMTAAKA